MAARADATAGNDERARTEFEEGRIAYDRADFPNALKHFEAAHALSGRPALLYNIARAADSEGLFEKAAASYAAYLEAVPEADNREFARGRLASIRERLATQPPAAPPVRAPAQVGTLTVDARPPATALSIDGVPVAASNQPLQLSPGAHEIVVGTQGYEAETRRVSVSAGEAQSITILFTRPATTTAATQSKPRRRLVRNPWLWTAVGVVVAAGATGTAVALSRDSGTKFDDGTAGARGKTP